MAHDIFYVTPNNVPHIEITLKASAGAGPTEDSNENIKKGVHTIATLHVIYCHIHK